MLIADKLAALNKHVADAGALANGTVTLDMGEPDNNGLTMLTVTSVVTVGPRTAVEHAPMVADLSGK